MSATSCKDASAEVVSIATSRLVASGASGSSSSRPVVVGNRIVYALPALTSASATTIPFASSYDSTAPFGATGSGALAPSTASGADAQASVNVAASAMNQRGRSEGPGLSKQQGA